MTSKQNAKESFDTLLTGVTKARAAMLKQPATYPQHVAQVEDGLFHALNNLAIWLTDRKYEAAGLQALKRNLHKWLADDYTLSHLTVYLPDGGYSRLVINGDTPRDTDPPTIGIDHSVSLPLVKQRWQELIR